jgi:mannose-6-phosphate isomerase-like protein (cupin superfamily)
MSAEKLAFGWRSAFSAAIRLFFQRGLQPRGNSRKEASVHMKEFPEFMKQPVNRIATSSQATPGVEGYVFDGADGSQMAFWTCSETTPSSPHVHGFDEYMVVVQGCYTLIIYAPNSDDKRIPIKAGEECFIPRGVLHGGEVEAGTRTINAFGGHRANRIKNESSR